MANIGLLEKGSILVGTGTQNVPLAAGADGDVLTVDSLQPSGLGYAPAGGGGGGDTLTVGALAYFAVGNGDAYLSSKYLKCSGQILSQATYPVLFSRVGLLNQPGLTWTSRTPLGTNGFTIQAATFGANFVLGGSGGTNQTSTDGITWVKSNIPFTSVSALAFGNSIYVAASGLTVATSTDGVQWRTRSPATYTCTFGIVYVAAGPAIGSGPILCTSTDTEFWTTQANTFTATDAITGVAYNSGVYVACGLRGFINTSTDGITWVARTSGTLTAFNAATYGGGLFVLAGTGQVFTSTDGVAWTQRTVGPASAIGAVAYLNGLYLAAMGFSGTLYTSTDTITWTSRTSSTVNQIQSFAFGNSTYVLVASGGSICTSTDATTWTARTSGTASILYSVAFGAGVFAAVGQNGLIYTSTDGISWTNRLSNSNEIRYVIYDGSKFVAGGPPTASGNSQMTSTDGITWVIAASTPLTFGQAIQDITFGGGQFIYVSSTGKIGTSTDATATFTAQTSGTTSNLFAVTYGSVYVAAGAGGVLLTSTDAVTWSARTSGTTSQIQALTYGNLYVYGASGGLLASSTDGITWTPRTSGTTSNISKITWASVSGIYVYGGAGGLLGNSTDGISWVRRISGTVNNVNALANGAGIFVAGQTGPGIQTSNTQFGYDQTTQFQLPTENVAAGSPNATMVNELQTNFFRNLYIKAIP